jgi:hypothetical protein
MWRNRRSLISGAVLIVVIILLGYLRDYLFISINYYIKQAYYSLETVYHPALFALVGDLSISELNLLKWVLTILFMLFNYGLSYIILKKLFIETTNSSALLSYGYMLLFILSGLLYIGGKILGFPEVGYTLSRRFMGVLQSPVPLMVVAAVHLLFGSSSKN